MEANEIILLIQGNVPHKPTALENHGMPGALLRGQQRWVSSQGIEGGQRAAEEPEMFGCLQKKETNS